MMWQLLRRVRKASKLLGVPLYRRALMLGAAAGIEHEALMRSLSCSLVLDVGANKGQFALVAVRYFPNARIVSFEPLSGPAAKLRAVFGTNSSVTLHQAAIGPHEADQTIHVSARTDSSSLLPITELQEKIFPGTAESHSEIVKVAPLTKFLSASQITRPALLKIDVQGFELAVLEGCEPLLPLLDYIYVECSFVELYGGQALANDVTRYLMDKGFRLAGVYNLANDTDGLAVQGDFFFTRA